MKATSVANRTSVISLLEQGYSVRDIEKRTGLGKSTVGRIEKGMDTDKENNLSGHPFKLSARDKTSIIHQKFNQESWILLFSYQFYPSTPCPSTNSQKGTSGERFTVCHKEESTHVEEDSSSEAARICSTA